MEETTIMMDDGELDDFHEEKRHGCDGDPRLLIVMVVYVLCIIALIAFVLALLATSSVGSSNGSSPLTTAPQWRQGAESATTRN
jgi:hypothetical protein